MRKIALVLALCSFLAPLEAKTVTSHKVKARKNANAKVHKSKKPSKTRVRRNTAN